MTGRYPRKVEFGPNRFGHLYLRRSLKYKQNPQCRSFGVDITTYLKILKAKAKDQLQASQPSHDSELD